MVWGVEFYFPLFTTSRGREINNTSTKGNVMGRKTYRVKANYELVDLPSWEDAARERGLMVSLEEAGLEEYVHEHAHGIYHSNEGSIYSYTDWFYEDADTFSVI